MKHFHIKYAGNRWELTESDHSHAASAFRTKDEAIGKVMALLMETPGHVEIRRGDGTVEEEWAIGLPG
jgi:hypothetical protein